MKARIIMLYKAVFLILVPVVFLQAPAISQKKGDTHADTLSLKDLLRRGNFNAAIRLYQMNTINEGTLKDYTSLAVGAGIGYETPEFKGWQFKLSGFFIFNLASSDLSKPDPLTNQFSRYELGLFDLTDPSNKTNMDRLEELFLKYRFKKTTASIGRQVLKTPFINPQDGRMRPTLEEAIWVNSKDIKNLTLQGGWISRVSPRSTQKWYTTGKSIGVYSPGVDEFGKPSAYVNNTSSKGIGMLGVSYDKKIKIQAWNTWVQNVMNTFLLQADKNLDLNNGNKIVLGLQLIAQQQSGNGGNADTAKQYYANGNRAFAISSRLGYEKNRTQVNINYTRITRTGRYLLPREWGVDPFYTFMPRERNEGYGDLQAINTNFIYHTKNEKWEIRSGYGYYRLPDIKDFKFNKYGMSSYHQVNAQLTCHFTGFWKGLEAMLLLVYKDAAGETYHNPRYTDNKVNLFHSSLVFNYRF